MKILIAAGAYVNMAGESLFCERTAGTAAAPVRIWLCIVTVFPERTKAQTYLPAGIAQRTVDAGGTIVATGWIIAKS